AYFVTISAMAADRYVVAWQTSKLIDYTYVSMAQIFEDDGTPVAPAFVISPLGTSHRRQIQLAPLNEGGFIATWGIIGARDVKDDVTTRLFDQQGQPITNEFFTYQSNTQVSNDQVHPSVNVTSSGQILTSYSDNSTGLFKINASLLTPGSLGDDILRGDQNDNVLIGRTGHNTLYGEAGNDTFYQGTVAFGGEGDDTFYGGQVIDGGNGNDTVVIAGQSADYQVIDLGGSHTVTDSRAGSPDGSRTLTNIEVLKFTDTQLSL
ncbi:MAG: Ca2+-binding RTX toxin-like protein, partial [Phenylobacterium sp.]